MSDIDWKEWDQEQRRLRLAEQAIYRQVLERKERQLVRLRKTLFRLRCKWKAVQAYRPSQEAPQLDLGATIGG